MQTNLSKTHYSVIIVGGGQAGLSMSYYLQESDIDHLVIEKQTSMNAWKDKRWDSFTLVTPNWQCQLPGHAYDGDDPNGFMGKAEILDYLDRFSKKVNVSGASCFISIRSQIQTINTFSSTPKSEQRNKIY